MAVRGRAFLSEHADDNRICYYKGGLAERNPPLLAFGAIRCAIAPDELNPPQLDRRLARRRHVTGQLQQP